MARLITATNRSTASRPQYDDIPPQVKRQIEKLAYRLFEERGRQPGRALEDWLEAERRILGNSRRR